MVLADVTVVIPTRNRPQRTLEAIQSVFEQTRPPQKVIVVDDASEDDTSDQIADRFGSSVTLLRHRTCGGANMARNAGAAAADTQYIAFLDSDDQFLPDKLSRQIAVLDETGAGFSTTGWVTDAGKPYTLPNYSDRLLLKRNCLGGTSGLVMRRSLFDIEHFDPKMLAVQDWELYLRLIRHTQPAVIPHPLYVYGLAETDRITINNRKRALGHFRLYRTHIKNNPAATLGIKSYHRLVQRVLTDKNPTLSKRTLNKILLRLGLALS